MIIIRAKRIATKQITAWRWLEYEQNVLQRNELPPENCYIMSETYCNETLLPEDGYTMSENYLSPSVIDYFDSQQWIISYRHRRVLKTIF